MNQCIIHRDCRTWAAASFWRLSSETSSSYFVLLSFPASQGKNECLVSGSGDPWSQGKQEESCVVSHILYFCMAKRRITQLCDLREFVWKIALLWNCQVARQLEGVFASQWYQFMSRGLGVELASLSSLGAEFSHFKPRWLGMLVLTEFLLSAGSAEVKGELKEKPTGGHRVEMLARNIFLSLSSQNCWVHWSIFHHQRVAQKKLQMKERSMLNLTWGMLENYQMNKRSILKQ